MPIVNEVAKKWPLAAPVPRTPTPKKAATKPPSVRRKKAAPEAPTESQQVPQNAFERALEAAANQMQSEAELAELAIDDTVCPYQDQACCRCFCADCK